MARRNKRNRYDADAYDDSAALLAKAARRSAYLAGQTGHERPNAAGVHGPNKRQKRRNDRHQIKAELRGF